MIPPMVSAFFGKWGLYILAGLLALGLGFGFWLYVGEINDDRNEAVAEAAELRATNLGLVEAAATNAERITGLTERLDAEQQLAQTRLDTEQARREAAERRNNHFAGALDDLRKDLEPLPCGIGSVLSDGLRDARDARETERRSREGRD